MENHHTEEDRIMQVVGRPPPGSREKEKKMSRVTTSRRCRRSHSSSKNTYTRLLGRGARVSGWKDARRKSATLAAACLGRCKSPAPHIFRHMA